IYFVTAPETADIYTLSLHDALPISEKGGIDYWHSKKDKGQADAIHQGFSRATGDYLAWLNSDDVFLPGALRLVRQTLALHPDWEDRKSTRLNSSHVAISYAVFCLKK